VLRIVELRETVAFIVAQSTPYNTVALFANVMNGQQRKFALVVCMWFQTVFWSEQKRS